MDWNVCKTKEVAGPTSGITALLVLWFTVFSPMIDAQLTPIESDLDEIKDIALENKSELDKREHNVFTLTENNAQEIKEIKETIFAMYGNQRAMCNGLDIECQ